ncbi:HugZ family protein [Methylocystis sp. JAN1]|uniref:HugZ family pyridoxamine 5'-phosphate oxidase n=1 Tax=Methylocystis sp. JAN1 TaxID=3397211 RepID=UPI003FA31413
MTVVKEDGPPRDPRQDPSFDPAGESRRLLRTVRTAALATLTQSGAPFATLTAIATDHDGTPILLLSRLAHHTGNLERDGRCSLLLAQGGRGDPMAHPRLTLVARAARTRSPTARARFLARNPKAQLYADFPDFSFWRAEIEAVHLNGGFARAADFGPTQLLTDASGAEPLIAAEAEILNHMNADHADALALYAEKLAGAKPGKWRASGIDPEGLDLVCGDWTARIAFPRPVKSPAESREVLVELARLAREA